MCIDLVHFVHKGIRHGSAIVPSLKRHHLLDLWSFLVGPIPHHPQSSTYKYAHAQEGSRCSLLDRRVSGLYVAWYWRHQSKSEFLATNRTQKGQTQRRLEKEHTHALPTFLINKAVADRSPAIPLALNFIASGEFTGHANALAA